MKTRLRSVVTLTELLAFIHSWRLPLLENVRVIYILSLATSREIRVLSYSVETNTSH